jgi:hypothetical protein
MKLIDRYVAEVGRRLPLVKGRIDIEKELRSTLEDMLEDRAQKSGEPADEAMEIELLKEYGRPQKVAETYNPHPYLIGPQTFPFFIKILKLVFFGVTVGLTVVTGIQIVTQTPLMGFEFAKIIGEGISNIISTLIAAFAYIVLGFAILERFAPGRQFRMDEEKEWDPASLMKEPEPNDVKPLEPIIAIVVTFIVLSIFNTNPQWIGFYTLSGDKWAVVPALTKAFFRLLPWINITWVAEIILNGILLRTGRWNTSTRVFSICIKLFQVGIGYFMLIGPPIIAITRESLLASGVFDADTAQTLGTMAQQGVRALIGLIIFITLIDVIKAIYKLVMQRSSAKE